LFETEFKTLMEDSKDESFFNYLGFCRDLKKETKGKDVRISFEPRGKRKVCV
jgi:hypothetical protein